MKGWDGTLPKGGAKYSGGRGRESKADVYRGRFERRNTKEKKGGYLFRKKSLVESSFEISGKGRGISS